MKGACKLLEGHLRGLPSVLRTALRLNWKRASTERTRASALGPARRQLGGQARVFVSVGILGAAGIGADQLAPEQYQNKGRDAKAL